MSNTPKLVKTVWKAELVRVTIVEHPRALRALARSGWSMICAVAGMAVRASARREVPWQHNAQPQDAGRNACA